MPTTQQTCVLLHGESRISRKDAFLVSEYLSEDRYPEPGDGCPLTGYGIRT